MEKLQRTYFSSDTKSIYTLKWNNMICWIPIKININEKEIYWDKSVLLKTKFYSVPAGPGGPLAPFCPSAPGCPVS